MFDLANFTFAEMTALGAVLRRMGDGANSIEEVANRIVRYLYDVFTCEETHQKACVLVRLFKTHPFEELDDELRQFATALLRGANAPPGMKCLTLLASVGENAEWNARERSRGHQAIPLVNEGAVQELPMIAQLFSQLGLTLGALQRSDPSFILDEERATFNVFHVAEAVGSPYVPAQKEFVIPHRIKSVVGFGGLLHTGDLFAVVLFSRVHVPRETAELFRTLALSTKLAMLSVSESHVFCSQRNLMQVTE